MADEEEPIEPKKKILVMGVSGYIGGNVAKRFQQEGFEVIGTLKVPSDPKPLAVERIVEPTAEALAAAFLESEMTVLDCLGDMEASEAMLSAIAAAGPLENPKVLVGISSVMTWARTSPDADEPEKPLTEAEYKKRRPHSSYKDLVALEKLVTKSKREGLRTHVVSAQPRPSKARSSPRTARTADAHSSLSRSLSLSLSRSLSLSLNPFPNPSPRAASPPPHSLLTPALPPRPWRPHVETHTVMSLPPALDPWQVAAGLTYGAEEDLFHALFKTAWSCAPLPLNTIADGSNVLPTVHVFDLCSAVFKLLENESLPYILAVDAPADEEKPQTLSAIVTALSAELGVGEVLPPPSRDDVLLIRDYEYFQVGAPIGEAPGLKLQGAAINDLGFEWHAQGGLLASLPMVVQEYRTARGLQPLRLLVHGNDDFAKTELAEALAAEYKLPYILASKAVADAMAKEDELGAELTAASGAGALSDELMAKVLVAQVSSTTCCNQGYILQGFPETQAAASLVFGGKKAGGEEGEEAPPEEEAEEGASKASLTPAPEFVIVLEAAEEVIKAKLLAQETPSVTEEKLSEALAEYAKNNAEDSETSILALPALADAEPLGPLAVTAETTLETLMTKARVYLGQPRNYGPTDDEIAAKQALEEAEAAKVAAEAARVSAEREAAEAAERTRREEHESRRAAEVQQQEQELLEVRSIPLRNYLMQNVIPTLTEGLIEVCKLKPEDPVDYLADYLFKNNPVEDETFH